MQAESIPTPSNVRCGTPTVPVRYTLSRSPRRRWYVAAGPAERQMGPQNPDRRAPTLLGEDGHQTDSLPRTRASIRPLRAKTRLLPPGPHAMRRRSRAGRCRRRRWCLTTAATIRSRTRRSTPIHPGAAATGRRARRPGRDRRAGAPIPTSRSTIHRVEPPARRRRRRRSRRSERRRRVRRARLDTAANSGSSPRSRPPPPPRSHGPAARAAVARRPPTRASRSNASDRA